MVEFLLSVLSSIIGNLLTPTFKDKIGFKDYELPERPQAPLINEEDEESLELRRQYMKEQWEIYSWNFFLLFVLFSFITSALTLPVVFKTNFFSNALECGATRFVMLCDGIAWSPDSIKPCLVTLVIFWALVIWYLAQNLTFPLARYIHINCRRVDLIFFKRIHAMVIMLLAFFLAGHWIYVLSPTIGYGWAVALPFIMIGAAGVFSSRR
ncbi:MAG: hypothetical protein Q7K57_25610 [Burkholderiaceae bacterium]|nr:hypothetical protein [Burkholderiaceae bacterium]